MSEPFEVPVLPPPLTKLAFALLHHTNHGPEHYDLLVQIPSQVKLLTWRLDSLPNSVPSPTAERIGDHRPIYLEYEGAISGDRGAVKRIASGMATLIEHSSTAVALRLPQPFGTTLDLPL